MDWSRAAALASASCKVCKGAGYLKRVPCGCVTRGIFRACYAAYQSCGRRPSYKRSEYRADFELVAKRTLSKSDHAIFQAHFLDRRLKLERTGPVTFHDIYRIEQKLGRAFAETEPYPLFPLHVYAPVTPLDKS